MINKNKILKQEDSSPEFQSVKKAIKDTKDKKMAQRYYAVLYHLKGYRNKEIAKLLDIGEHTIGRYIKKYNKDGLIGLNRQYSTGAPHYLNSDQESYLVNVITNNTPDEVRFAPRKNWTINIVRQWVKNTYGIEFSRSGMADVLYRLKLSYTRPAYVLAKADPQKQEFFQKEFENH